MSTQRELIATELDRITTRVTGLNLTRLENCAPAIHSCAQELVDLTFSAKGQTTVDLPIAGVSAVSAQLTVVVRDYLRETEPDDEIDRRVIDALTQLRRDLP